MPGHIKYHTIIRRKIWDLQQRKYIFLSYGFIVSHIFEHFNFLCRGMGRGAVLCVRKRGCAIVEEIFLEAAASNGVWAALSLALIFFILRAQEKRDAKQDEREQNYQKIIEELTQKLNIVADMQGNIERIRDAVTTHRYETDDP